MRKSRSPNRDKAFEIYKSNKGRISLKNLAQQLDEKISNIYQWKSKDCWDERINRKAGAPQGNQNAKGNKGGSAPKGNLNGLKHGNYCEPSKFLDKGFLSKYIPAATKSIIKGMVEEGVRPLDILWDNIMLCYSGIIRSQKIMNVTSKNEIVKELKKTEVSPGKWGDSEKEEYEVQFAWDRQERFLKAQSIAMGTLANMIKQYEELLHKNWDLATEEQKLRVDKLRVEVKELTKNTDDKSVNIKFIRAGEQNG